jgi:hypothetical protein
VHLRRELLPVDDEQNLIGRQRDVSGCEQPRQGRADIKGFTTDAQTLVAKLNAAEAEATHQSVKSAIGKASGDMSAMLSALKAVENGNTSQISVLDNKANSLSGDGTAIDNICSSL